jgi:hypothetical protein
MEVADRVVVADRGRHQALGVRRRRGQRDLQPGTPTNIAVDRAGVLTGPAGGEAVAGLEHERHLDLAAAHVAKARRLVDDLVHRDQHELGHVQLDDRAQAGQRAPTAMPISAVSEIGVTRTRSPPNAFRNGSSSVVAMFWPK